MKNTQNIVQKHFEAGILSLAMFFLGMFFSFPYMTHGSISVFKVRHSISTHIISSSDLSATEMPTTYLSAFQ